MKVEAASHTQTVTATFVKGVCPICGILKQYQAELIESLSPEYACDPCNFHCWTLANSAVGSIAASIYRRLLSEDHQDNGCKLCAQIREEEETRVQQLARELQEGLGIDWMSHYGTLCVVHANALKNHVALRLRPVIDEIVDRNINELKQQLQDYSTAAEHGTGSGGGVLGRAAGFLVGYRGLSS